ncbi:phenylalanine--tRNA ligase subunit alpha [Thermofilum pendens]|uniref:phenylalanine--tRNA ligase n=1 Tax=Thermofilum pendens (strain DSM 2475 / Hrk 5) TaxID=368408 RepID=A1RYS0_THEPD|nr:phenylalanine--tRNA ligase subunit alpha [Thermofilum pendens]ABL78350.1 phenylalanyl-tRNA synthetase, alpha subunit [Thermofilum pendens Hrk 5]
MSSLPQKRVFLPARQKRILDAVLSGASDLDEIAGRLGARREDLMRDVEELRARGFVEVERREVERLSLTREGEEYLEKGLPEERLLALLEARGAVRRGEVAALARELGVELGEEEAQIAFSHLARAGAVSFSGDEVRLSDPEKARRHVESVKESLLAVKQGRQPPLDVSYLKRRRLVEPRRYAVILLRPSEAARRLAAEGLLAEARVVTELTGELIVSGGWREVVFKEFDLSVEVPQAGFGRKHPYLEFLDWVREILVSMGFEEMKGPHVELELWNFDALFQAQDHPAREIHDTYFVKGGATGRVGDEELLRRIALTHENGWVTGSKGWGYKWDPARALRLILRTQTTAVSARTLYARGEGEYMCFSLDRVFRPENLDAKHSMEFYQLEGIIVGRRVTFRNLLGFFQEMSRRLGLGEVKVKPAYFPFTEPSVEGFIKHPKLGWIEVFPGGMFRPEVLAPLGLRGVNVAAWGIGIDRIAMTVLGVDDIRVLFSQDLEYIKSSPRPLPLSLVTKG